MYENAVRNAEGLIGVEHWNSNPSPYTSPNYNVSIGWVREEDLPEILATKVKACCGVNQNKYHLASANNVSVWMTGHYP